MTDKPVPEWITALVRETMQSYGNAATDGRPWNINTAMRFAEEAVMLAAAPAPALSEVAWIRGERELALRWMQRLLAKLNTKPEHADDCLWLMRLHALFSDASPVQVERAEAKPVASPAEGEAGDDEPRMPHSGMTASQAAAFINRQEIDLAWGAHPTPSEAAGLLRKHAREKRLPPNDNDYDDAAAVIERLVAMIVPASADREAATREAVATHQHVKRGTEYVLLGYGKMQTTWWRKWIGAARDSFVDADMSEVAIYRSVDDGSLWARPREEFEDGRFRALAQQAKPQQEKKI